MDYNAASPMGNPPQLGTPIPGTTGGLPMQGGLNVAQNPMAQQLQSQGRGEDSMLVHMTPDEVNSLQGLAMAHGGSLTINPETGLPEAGFLKKLLPTLLGAALTATGIGAPLAAGLVAAGSIAKTGSLKKGLMAGLQAYGGAGMAGAAGLGGKISSNAFGALSNKAGVFGANMGAGVSQAGNAAAGIAKLGSAPVENAINVTGAMPGAPTAAALNPVQTQAVMGGNVLGSGTQAAMTGVAPTATTGAQFTGGLGSRFAQATRAGLPAGTPGIISKAAPMLAAQGLMSGISGAMTASGGSSMGPSGQIDNSYQGPYFAQQRKPVFAGTTEDILAGEGGQQRYFDVDMPEIYNTMGQVVQPGSHTVRGTQIMQPVLNPKAKKGQNMYDFRPVTYMGGIDPNEADMGYADGGEVDMQNGSFVVDARTVSELGNGSSNAGMELLSRMGGRPLQGPGDGVSDSIRASIGGKQEARVARDEVLFPPEAVKRLGSGSAKKGTEKLYSLMNKAHKARKKAKRGQDTKLRRGLA